MAATRKKRKITYHNVVVEIDADGMYVASVPELPGCHTQATSLDILMERIREAIELCLLVGQPFLHDRCCSYIPEASRPSSSRGVRTESEP